MENVFEKFNKEFFAPIYPKSKIKIKWFDRTGVFILGNKTVSITLYEQKTKSNFDSYLVSVVVTTTGVEATRKIFTFKDHISKWTRSKDTVNSYYHAWYDMGELEWYIDKPFETRTMVEKMFDYITQYI